MNARVRRAFWPSLLIPFLLGATPSCEEQAPDLREWRPSDHDHTTNPGNDQVEGGPDAGTAPELAAHGLNEVVIVAWEQNCVRCHGRFGRGDGPQGPMVHAADLTNAAWQGTAKDDDIYKAIRDGRGLMPAFPLPEPTLRALVQLVRLLGQAATPHATDPAAPAASAPHPVRGGPAAHPSAASASTAPKSPHGAPPPPNGASVAPPASSNR
jgi:mono/diheme cytochrome c family protein